MIDSGKPAHWPRNHRAPRSLNAVRRSTLGPDSVPPALDPLGADELEFAAVEKAGEARGIAVRLAQELFELGDLDRELLVHFGKSFLRSGGLPQNYRRPR